jgi:transcriptional repressor of cell division inhibition gene dicB
MPKQKKTDKRIKINRSSIHNEICQHFGGTPQLAKLLNISRTAIYKWKAIPEGRAYQIEILSNGKFKAKDII